MTTTTVGNAVVGTTPVQVVAALTGRVQLLLSKAGGVPVYVGIDDTVSPSTGFAWDFPSPLSLPATGAVWAVVSGDESNTTAVTVSWLSVGP
jgi:hypothetical protein